MNSGVLWKGRLIIVAVRFGKSPGLPYNFFVGLANCNIACLLIPEFRKGTAQ